MREYQWLLIGIAVGLALAAICYQALRDAEVQAVRDRLVINRRSHIIASEFQEQPE